MTLACCCLIAAYLAGHKELAPIIIALLALIAFGVLKASKNHDPDA